MVLLEAFVCLAHLCRIDSASLTIWTGLFLIDGVSGWISLLLRLIEILEFNGNSEFPDKTPRSVCQCPFIWNARDKWVNELTSLCLESCFPEF